jgi:hypothetical protein
MSSPYVYIPEYFQQTPYVDPYYSQPQSSPFFPPEGLHTHSPFASPRVSPLPSPSPRISQSNTPRRVHFEDEIPLPELSPRARRPSWHGASPHLSSPMGLGLQFMQPSPSPSFYSHLRRHSFGNAPEPSWFNTPIMSSPWMYSSQPTQFRIHPLLNGEAPRPDFFFDLSSPKFSPLRVLAPGHTSFVDIGDLREPATHPPITRLRIVCDAIPHWPIEIQQDTYQTMTTLSPIAFPSSLPPITLGDILVALHRGLHQQITHLDWAKLSVSEEIAVSRAYTRRCKSVSNYAQLEANQGVKRVDFLLDVFMFRGLMRVPSEDNWETWKLLIA